MKTNKKLLLPLLILSPVLLANAPVPRVNPGYYDDFHCVYDHKTSELDEYGNTVYKYVFKVTNDGEGFISTLSVDSEVLHEYVDGEPSIFGNELVYPHESRLFSVLSSVDFDPSSVEFTYHCEAYQQFVDGFTTDKKDIRVDARDGRYYYYVEFDTNINIKKDNKHEYGAITNVEYKGDKFLTHHEIDYNYEFYLCSSDEELDLEQLSIKKMFMTIGPAYNSGFSQLAIAFVIVLGMILVGGGIFLIIFFSTKKSREKKNEDVQVR